MKKYIYILMAALAISACHSSHAGHEGHDHEHEAEAETENSDEIQFSESKQERFGVKSEPVVLSNFSEIIHVGGSILPASGDELCIIAPVSGTITIQSGKFNTGARINSGEKVASMSTRSIAGGDILAKAKASWEAARMEYSRDSVLLAEKIVSAAHFEQSKLAYEQAKAEYEAVAAHQDNSGNLDVKSPAKGFVKAVNVTSGQYVEAGQVLATISQSKTLQLRADVPDRYAGSLASICDATFTMPDGSSWRVSELGGRVISYGRICENGYIPVIFQFAEKSAIVPGAFADIYLKSKSEQKVIAVPNDAIVEQQGIYSVYVRLDEDCFMRKDVVLGQTDGRRTVVLEGLQEGDELVTSGAMQIKLSSFTSVPHGHSHNH